MECSDIWKPCPVLGVSDQGQGCGEIEEVRLSGIGDRGLLDLSGILGAHLGEAKEGRQEKGISKRSQRGVDSPRHRDRCRLPGSEVPPRAGSGEHSVLESGSSKSLHTAWVSPVHFLAHGILQ